MSRCFPYPPPGYARKVARTEAALIESIKLPSERREKGSERTKEKSKHKKEKSKDKKHKSKEHRDKSSRPPDSNDQKRKEAKDRRHDSNDQKRKEAKDLLKGTKVEAEQLEKSGLTEEHGQPVWPQSPGYLSDGTQTNHKRKRGASLQPDEDCKPGKVIRIKLASSLSQQEDSSAGSEQTCSTTGRDNSLDQKRDENSQQPIEQKTCLTIADTADAAKDPISKPKTKDLPLLAVDIGTRRRHRKPSESAYDALFEKWVPPPHQLEQQTDDEEWLFGTRKQDEKTKTNKAFSHAPICRSSSLWPRGQYLPDADVYLLPYSIPF